MTDSGLPKKSILIFIDWFLPGYKAGGPISSNANLINHLNREFKFYIVTRNTDYCETTPYNSVKSDIWNPLIDNVEVYYFSKSKLGFRNITKSVKNISFDKVYINGIYSLYFSIFPLIWFKYVKHKPIVVAARGMLSDHTFSSKKSKKKFFYSISRFLRLYNTITFHATNNDEAQQIRKNVAFKGEIKIAPNLPPYNKNEFYNKAKSVGELKLISIARISEEKNTLYALQVLKSCKAKKIIFHLYGTIYNEAYWNECQKIIAALPKSIEVSFKGAINKTEIPELLKQYHFLFMPSQGENYGHSIIESLLAGCPVIISDRTPWRGLKEKGIGWDLPLKSPNLFVEAIEYCTELNQSEYTSISQRAFEFAKEVTNNQAVVEANRQLFL